MVIFETHINDILAIVLKRNTAIAGNVHAVCTLALSLQRKNVFYSAAVSKSGNRIQKTQHHQNVLVVSPICRVCRLLYGSAEPKVGDSRLSFSAHPGGVLDITSLRASNVA